MQSGRPHDVHEDPYSRDNNENIVGQPREQKFYAHAVDLNSRFASRTIPEGYTAQTPFDRNAELSSQPQAFSHGSRNEVHEIQQYNYVQSPHKQAILTSDNFTIPLNKSTFDPTGQQCPPGGNPRVSTTIWEDEGTLCFQVEAKQMTVARREGTSKKALFSSCADWRTDNDMINGTKLLNVAQMSRGKRDGILKNEPDRTVIKVGSMHLKGVWYVVSAIQQRRRS